MTPELALALCESGAMRVGFAIAAILAAGMLSPPTGSAAPPNCDELSCVPGVTPGAVLGAPCADTAYYVFGTTSWGRLVFCGSPRRYEPRYFRSPSMWGVKEEGASCTGYENGVAQAPDGLFLSCVSADGASRWVRGDA
jgi:hypothetical protein